MREDSSQFIKENNKETLAQVFTDVRYKKEDNIAFSKHFPSGPEGSGIYEPVGKKFNDYFFTLTGNAGLTGTSGGFFVKFL